MTSAPGPGNTGRPDVDGTAGENSPLRQALAALARTALPGHSCLPPQRFWEAATGSLAPGEIPALVAHGIECPACGEAWRLAHEMASGLRPRRQEAHQPAAGGAWIWWRVAAVAAMVALAALFIQTFQPGETLPPGYRDAVAPPEVPIGSLLPAGEPVSRRRFVLRWSGPPTAHYDIWVSDENLTMLSEAKDLHSSFYQVPVDQIRQLPPGAHLFWRVEAILKDQRRVGSPTFTTILKDP